VVQEWPSHSCPWSKEEEAIPVTIKEHIDEIQVKHNLSNETIQERDVKEY
jgi:hypothetical protein